LFVSAGCEYRGTVAGNGGQMAGTIEAKLERSVGKVTQARRKAADAPAKKTTGRASLKKGVGTGTAKVAKASKKAKQEETAGEEGLRVAASKAISRNKENLARHLLSEALHGKGAQADRLFRVVDPKNRQKKDEEQERPHESLALLLESEPEWRGEQSEEAAETGRGGLEPEG
jgi:hypothetical protein